MGVAIAILVGVTLLGAMAAGALWWVTKSSSTTRVTVASESHEDASAPTPDAEHGTDARSAPEAGVSDAATADGAIALIAGGRV